MILSRKDMDLYIENLFFYIVIFSIIGVCVVFAYSVWLEEMKPLIDKYRLGRLMKYGYDRENFSMSRPIITSALVLDLFRQQYPKLNFHIERETAEDLVIVGMATGINFPLVKLEANRKSYKIHIESIASLTH